MILRNPLESSYLKYSNVRNIFNDIDKYIVTDYEYIKEKVVTKFPQFSNNGIVLNPVVLYGFSEHEKNIEHFVLPLINKENNYIALDLRPFINIDKNNISFDVKNNGEYSLAIERFMLIGMWATEMYNQLYTLKFPHFAFGNWISDNLTKRFALSLENNIQLKVASYIYYSHLFTDNFNDDDFSKLVIRLKEDIISQEIVYLIYEKTKGNYNSLNDFAKACYLATNNIKLNGLDDNILLNLTINNWIGIEGKKLTMLSLEYPPIWISLVHASLNQRNFKKNYISNIVERLDKRGKGDEFNKAYDSLVKNLF